MPQLLIIQPSPLRDIVHGLQLAASLKTQRPELRIAWIVRDIFAPLVRICEVIDDVHVFHRSEGVRGFFQLMKEIRRTRYDYVFDLQGLLRTALMTWQARGARKYGRSDAREGAPLFYRRKVPLPPEGLQSHALEIQLQFCRALSAEGAPAMAATQPMQPGSPSWPQGRPRLSLAVIVDGVPLELRLWIRCPEEAEVHFDASRRRPSQRRRAQG